MAAMDERQAQELVDAEAAYRAEVEETNAVRLTGTSDGAK